MVLRSSSFAPEVIEFERSSSTGLILAPEREQVFTLGLEALRRPPTRVGEHDRQLRLTIVVDSACLLRHVCF